MLMEKLFRKMELFIMYKLKMILQMEMEIATILMENNRQENLQMINEMEKEY